MKLVAVDLKNVTHKELGMLAHILTKNDYTFIVEKGEDMCIDGVHHNTYNVQVMEK